MGRMVLRDKAHLARGRTGRVDDQMGLDQRFDREGSHQRAAGVVLADNPDEDAARTQRCDIARHVAGAGDDDLAARYRQNGRRRFG